MIAAKKKKNGKIIYIYIYKSEKVVSFAYDPCHFWGDVDEF